MIDLNFIEIVDTEFLDDIDFSYNDTTLTLSFRCGMLGKEKRLGIIFFLENEQDLELMIHKVQLLRKKILNKDQKRVDIESDSTLIWDNLFKEILRDILKSSYSTEEVKEIFAIGLEIYNYKKLSGKKVFGDDKKEEISK